MPPRLKALFLLAWALIRTVFRRIFTKNNDGILVISVENYAADRLPPVNPDERELLKGFGKRIACGLCDRGEGARIASNGTYRGVMSLMLAASRNMPDFDAAALSFAHGWTPGCGRYWSGYKKTTYC